MVSRGGELLRLLALVCSPNALDVRCDADERVAVNLGLPDVAERVCGSVCEGVYPAWGCAVAGAPALVSLGGFEVALSMHQSRPLAPKPWR